MANTSSAARDFLDTKGEVLAHMDLEIIQREGQPPLVRWRMTDANGNKLDEDKNGRIPKPFRGEASADRVLLRVVADLAQRTKMPMASGSAHETAAAEFFRRRREELDPELWSALELLIAAMQRPERVVDIDDDDDVPGLARVLHR